MVLQTIWYGYNKPYKNIKTGIITKDDPGFYCILKVSDWKTFIIQLHPLDAYS